MKNLSVKHEYFVKVILLSVIFLFILLEIILALTPPVARDVLIHHLAMSPSCGLSMAAFMKFHGRGFLTIP